MANQKNLLATLTEAEAQPWSRGLDLRLALSKLILSRLRSKGWTQKRLAEAAGMKESFITRIVHGDQNCTLDVAGRLLFALGTKATLVAEEDMSYSRQSSSISTSSAFKYLIVGTNHGKKEPQVEITADAGPHHTLLSVGA
jgi:transcriptional regulator with XRE-family HTH domain